MNEISTATSIEMEIRILINIKSSNLRQARIKITSNNEANLVLFNFNAVQLYTYVYI